MMFLLLRVESGSIYSTVFPALESISKFFDTEHRSSLISPMIYNALVPWKPNLARSSICLLKKSVIMSPALKFIYWVPGTEKSSYMGLTEVVLAPESITRAVDLP